MTLQTSKSLKSRARLGGALYLFIIIAGIYGEAIVRNRLIVAGNPAATAQNILGSEFLFRSAIMGDLLMHLCDVPVTLILYFLLKPVSKPLSVMAASFSMIQTAILAANKLNLVAVVVLLGGVGYAQMLQPSQLHAFVSLCLAMHEHGLGVGLLFFGMSCLVVGYLMYRSSYFPNMLGVLQALAGGCYLLNSTALLLFPMLAAKMFPAILLPAFIGELATALWMLVRGVRVEQRGQAIRT